MDHPSQKPPNAAEPGAPDQPRQSRWRSWISLAAIVLGNYLFVRFLFPALLERETLDEQEILSVTGLPPAPMLRSDKIPA